MCGIGGIFVHRGPRPAGATGLLDRIHAHQVKRGPDGEGLWWSDNRRVGLSHRRLAIIDLDDRALQPFHFESEGLSIVFNGEIYNYRELRERLVLARGVTFRTESDTEVILGLFQAYGEDVVTMLRGMFAFAIWDEKRQRLFVARDPYGIKPLYYADDGYCFRFASQVKALATDSALSREVDSAGVVGFHIWGSVPEPFTLYEAIRALPAGNRMWVTARGHSEPERFAHIAAALATASPSAEPVENAVAAAVSDSVRAHLVADVEVGLFLSSGIDSGALLGLMRDAGHSRIRTVTLGFEELKGQPEDEVPLAEEVAGQYGANHCTRVITREDFHKDVEQLFSDMDQPTVDGINTWFVSKAAHECGLKVVLSGLGADELLGGYSTFRSVPSMHQFGRIAARVPLLDPIWQFLLTRFAPAKVRSNPKLLGVPIYSRTLAGAYLLRRAVLLPFELDRRLDAEMLKEGLERLRPLELIDESITPAPPSAVARIAALESSLYMRNQLLRDADWASMAHSLELRVPFVDWPTLHRLAPFMHAFGAGRGKRALANAPESALPMDVITRAKTGFSVPVGRWTGGTEGRNRRLDSRDWLADVARAFGLADLRSSRS
jgi:asparagine synthase (glutamine-hydrolysing)